MQIPSCLHTSVSSTFMLFVDKTEREKERYSKIDAKTDFKGLSSFLPADSLWTFCMAMNVYLTFFKNYNATDLRALEKWYILGCYSIPMIPAICLLIYDSTMSENIYGDALVSRRTTFRLRLLRRF